MNENRDYAVALSTKNALFVFGDQMDDSYEYLPKDSTTWLMGKNEIPDGFYDGWGIEVKSEKEVWLIGGNYYLKRILSFDIEHHTFQELDLHLNIGRSGHRGAFIPNTKKILITGGHGIDGNGILGKVLNSTEILDTEFFSVTVASPMNFERSGHGMGVLTIDGRDWLCVFGGQGEGENIVERYNTQTLSWEITSIGVNEAKDEFGFVSIKIANILQF